MESGDFRLRPQFAERQFAWAAGKQIRPLVLAFAILSAICAATFLISQPGPLPLLESIFGSLFKYAGGSSAFRHLCLAFNQLLGGLL
jgi:hypothetical protein